MGNYQGNFRGQTCDMDWREDRSGRRRRRRTVYRLIALKIEFPGSMNVMMIETQPG
jgi:hypothetical protein